MRICVARGLDDSLARKVAIQLNRPGFTGGNLVGLRRPC